MIYLKREGKSLRNGIHFWLGNSSRIGALLRLGGTVVYFAWQYRLRYFNYGLDRA